MSSKHLSSKPASSKSKPSKLKSSQATQSKPDKTSSPKRSSAKSSSLKQARSDNASLKSTHSIIESNSEDPNLDAITLNPAELDAQSDEAIEAREALLDLPKTFNELMLDERLLQGLDALNFTRPTAIQAQAIPATLESRDILGSAPTGTGKSLAFLLPAMQHLLDFPRKHGGPPRVLVLTPTRELAEQIADQARDVAKFTHLAITTITGGVSYVNHAEIFSTNQDIVVATTGRLLQYIREENFDCRAVEMLILDEADRMLDMGFANDVETIAGETRWRKQTLLYSATLEGNDVYDFAQRVLTDPVEIAAESTRRERKKINLSYYRADDYTHKFAILLAWLKLNEVQKSIVFVRKRERVHEISRALVEQGIPNCYLEGELAQNKRQEAIKRLNNGTVNVLVATDVAARGIDIPDITHVFNFDLPRTADTFIHRIGRTARAGKKGNAILLVEAHDFLLLQKIERYIEEKIPLRVFDHLRPKSKTPEVKHGGKPSKKVKLAREKRKQEVKKSTPKVRARDLKNKGKPKPKNKTNS